MAEEGLGIPLHESRAGKPSCDSSALSLFSDYQLARPSPGGLLIKVLSTALGGKSHGHNPKWPQLLASIQTPLNQQDVSPSYVPGTSLVCDEGLMLLSQS